MAIKKVLRELICNLDKYQSYLGEVESGSVKEQESILDLVAQVEIKLNQIKKVAASTSLLPEIEN